MSALSLREAKGNHRERNTDNSHCSVESLVSQSEQDCAEPGNQGAPKKADDRRQVRTTQART